MLVRNAFKIYQKTLERICCLGRPYHFRFFKGCLAQILLGPFLNTLTHLSNKYIWHKWLENSFKFIYSKKSDRELSPISLWNHVFMELKCAEGGSECFSVSLEIAWRYIDGQWYLFEKTWRTAIFLFFLP